MEKSVCEFAKIFLIVFTRLLWSVTMFAFIASITLSALKFKNLVIIEWEQICYLVLFLTIFDPTLLIIDGIRFGMERNFMEGLENVER